MQKKESKPAAALDALEKIRKRIKPHQDPPNTPIVEESTVVSA